MSEVTAKKILLLGSNYIASNIALRLIGDYKDEPRNNDENLKITILDVDPPDMIFLNPKLARFQDHEALTKKQISQWDADFYSYREFKDYDAIINAASIDDSVFSTDNPMKTVYSNELFTAKLMDFLRRVDYPGRFIHISTHRVYGKIPPRKFTREPVTEEEPCNPYGPRSVSRHNQETIIKGLGNMYDLRYVILRFGTLFGDFVPQSKAIYNWTKSMMLREDLIINEPNRVLKPFSEGVSSRDFVHEYDACGAVRQLCLSDNLDKKEIDQEVYNIGGQGSTANGEIFVSNMAIAIKEMFKPWNPATKFIFKGWRHPDEAELRIWMASKKAEKKFGYDPIKDLVHATKNLSYFIGQYDLGWGVKEMHDWKSTGTSDIDAGLEMAYKTLYNKETGVSKEILDSIERGADLVGKE